MMMRDCRLSLSIIGPPICNVTKTNINLIVTNSLRTHPAVILMKGLTFKLIVQIKMIPTIIFFNLNINKMIGYILFGTTTTVGCLLYNIFGSDFKYRNVPLCAAKSILTDL